MRAASLIIVCAAAVGCGEAKGMSAVGARQALPPPPADCTPIAPGGSVQEALDDPAVVAVCLAPGLHRGPLRVTRAVTVWGPPAAVIHSATGEGVVLAAPGAALVGVTVDGIGGLVDRADAAVRITADDTRVEAVTVVRAVFGIAVERCRRVRVIGNRVEASRDSALGLRGDSMRLWETHDSVIEGNVVEDGRDIVVWYSRHNRLAGNRVTGGRYGLHFMYSHDNLVVRNQLLHGVVGIFVMYSRGIRLEDNLIAAAGGAAGMAIGLKDSGNIVIANNRLIRNTTGIYIDTSPAQMGDTVVIERNVLRLDDVAIAFHASARDVRIADNDFADNEVQVRVDGGGDATQATWTGNYFSDYIGYDFDDDGIGDVPYELRSFSEQLASNHPGVALFRGTPALAIADAASHLDPLFAPPLMLTDPAPRMRPQLPVDRQESSP